MAVLLTCRKLQADAGTQNHIIEQPDHNRHPSDRASKHLQKVIIGCKSIKGKYSPPARMTKCFAFCQLQRHGIPCATWDHRPDAAWLSLQAQRHCKRPVNTSSKHGGTEDTVACGKTSTLVCMPAGGREYQQDRHVEDEGAGAVSGHQVDICLARPAAQAEGGKPICVSSPRAQHHGVFLCSADFMKSVDNVPRSLACIFDGHKTEEAAELAANSLASVLQTREGMTEQLHMSRCLASAGTPLLRMAGTRAHDPTCSCCELPARRCCLREMAGVPALCNLTWPHC